MESLGEELLLQVASGLECLKDVRCFSIVSRRHANAAKPYIRRLKRSAKRVLWSWRRGILKRGGPRGRTVKATDTAVRAVLIEYGLLGARNLVPAVLLRTLARDYIHFVHFVLLRHPLSEGTVPAGVILGLQLRHLDLFATLPDQTRDWFQSVLPEAEYQQNSESFYRAAKLLWFCPTIHGAFP
ncbi:Hypothetical protein UVM_LOCUS475 [uncultured virus]|nr:Hypothetical protein UVM_LOCUS475 [uncultured virus]